MKERLYISDAHHQFNKMLVIRILCKPRDAQLLLHPCTLATMHSTANHQARCSPAQCVAAAAAAAAAATTLQLQLPLHAPLLQCHPCCSGCCYCCCYVRSYCHIVVPLLCALLPPQLLLRFTDVAPPPCMPSAM